MGPTLQLRGVQVYEEFLSLAEQAEMVEDIRDVVAAAPLIRPETRWGQKMSVRMTAAGQVGWVSDRHGYRYAARHPSGMAWPAIPETVLSVWHAVAGVTRRPECCLVNFYGQGAKMGMHQDRDEADFAMPVVSISLGDEARFRIGNLTRGGKTEALWLRSGDVVVMGGEARLRFHGIDQVRDGSSTLLPKGGRINLTLRVVS